MDWKRDPIESLLKTTVVNKRLNESHHNNTTWYKLKEFTRIGMLR
jgi:hypothetical protein